MKKIISVLAITSILLTSCGNSEKASVDKIEGKSVKVQTINKSNFSEQIKLVGKVSPIMETPVSALTAGIIKNLNAEVGKKVTKGQLLAQIDLSSSTYGTSYNNANTSYNNALNTLGFTEESIKNDLEAARVQLENAKTARENTYSTTDKQLEIAKTQLDNIKKNNSNTQITTSESLKNSQLMYDNAKTNLDNFEKNSKENIDSIYENLKVSLSSGFISIDSSVNFADIILGVTDKNKSANDTYEVYLGAKNTSTKTESEKYFNIVKNLYDKLLSTNYSNSKESIEQKTVDILNILSSDITLYNEIVLMLNNTITSSNFTQTQLDTMNLNVSKIQAAILTAQGQITGLKNTLSTTKSSIETNRISLNNAINIAEAQLGNIKAGNNSQLDSLSGNVELTQTQLDNTIATVKQARDSVDNAVKIAQASYDSVQAKLNAQRVQTKSAVDQAKGGKDLAGIQLNNTSIIAPFDGVITGRNAEVGTMVGAGTPVFTIGDDSGLKIKLDVNSDNITSLKLGQETIIKKGDKTSTGVITLLSPAADPTTKMFKAEISFNKKPDFMNLGDYVDIYISKESSGEKVIQLPFSSIISMGQGDYSVYVVGSDNIAHTRSVKLGNQNSLNVEITSGLKEGEKVVTSGTLNLSDGDLVKIEK